MRPLFTQPAFILLIRLSLCLFIVNTASGFLDAQDAQNAKQSQSQAATGRMQWAELDLDAVLNRPLDANRSMSRLRTDRKFLETTSAAEPTRLQSGDGAAYLWEETGYSWHSPTFCYSPLYFEQPNLERYGQGPSHPWAVPVSAGRFVGQVTTLPLAVICSPPWSRSCTLGHHRPGDFAPWQRQTSSH